jgi:hypothetical protein
VSRRLAVPIATAAVIGVSAPPASAWRPEFYSAVRYAKERQGQVGIAVIDSEGRFYGYRAGVRAPTASVLKPMLLAAYLRKRGVRHRPLRGWERRLVSPMIRRSDNAAAGRVLGLDGAGAVERLARLAGMSSFRLVWNPWGLSQTTARDQARFFHRFERMVPRRHRAYARRLLGHVVRRQRWGIAKLDVRPWRLFFKGGWGSETGWVDHQVAWLEHGRERVAVAIFTRSNPSHAYGNETLRGVAARLLRRLPGR